MPLRRCRLLAHISGCFAVKRYYVDVTSHKILDSLQHLWPYVAGISATVVGAFKLWWDDRKKLRSRIANVEIIAQHAVTQEKLAECRADVDEEDTAILKEIREIRRDMREDNKVNALAHNAIMENANKQQQELMRAILHLHSDG